MNKINLKKWRESKRDVIDGTAWGKIKKSYLDLKEAYDNLSYLHKPWVAAIYDQMDSLNVTGDLSVLKRLANVGEQNGLDAITVNAVLNDDYIMIGSDFSRVIEAVDYAQKMGRMGVDEGMAREAAKALVVSPTLFHYTKQYVRTASRFNRGDGGEVENISRRFLEEKEKHGGGSCYQQSMDKLKNPLQLALSKAQDTLEKIKSGEIGDFSEVEKFEDLILKSNNLLENNIKPSHTLSETRLGEGENIRKKLAIAKNNVEAFGKIKAELEWVGGEVKKASIIDDPDIQNHLLNEINMRFGIRNKTSLQDIWDMDIVEITKVNSRRGRDIIDNRNCILYDKDALSSPVLKQLIPQTLENSKEAPFVSEIDKEYKAGLSLLSRDYSEPLSSAIAMGLEECRWVDTTKNGDVERRMRGPYTLNAKKFWSGFLKEYNHQEHDISSSGGAISMIEGKIELAEQEIQKNLAYISEYNRFSVDTPNKNNIGSKLIEKRKNKTDSDSVVVGNSAKNAL